MIFNSDRNIKIFLEFFERTDILFKLCNSLIGSDAI